MIVATIDPQTKTAGILGIPRDTYVEIPNEDGSYFQERINTALEYGQIYNYPGGGPQAGGRHDRAELRHQDRSLHHH